MPQRFALFAYGFRPFFLLAALQAVALMQQETRRYAKRQMTWFRKEKSIIWVDSLRGSDKIQPLIDQFYVA